MAALLAYHGRRAAGPVRRGFLSRFERERKLAATLALRTYLAHRIPTNLETVRVNLPALKDSFGPIGSELRGIFLRHIDEVTGNGLRRRPGKGLIDQWMGWQDREMGDNFRP